MRQNESSFRQRGRRPPDASPSGRVARVLAGWERRVDEHVSFLKSFLREPGSIGAISPSSRFLARAMVAHCPLDSASTVVELGPGTGAFTGLIRERLRPAASLIALEVNADHVRGLRLKFPDLHVYHDSAERMAEYLALHGKKHADCIISGLPWAILPRDLQARLMIAIQQCLAPNGVLVAFGYAHARWMNRARLFREELQARFPRVETSPVVWGNLPPAFVYRCSR